LLPSLLFFFLLFWSAAFTEWIGEPGSPQGNPDQPDVAKTKTFLLFLDFIKSKESK
jgi:hypothetical protein